MATTSLSSTNTLTNAIPFVPATTTVAGTAGNIGAEPVNALSEYRIVTNQVTTFQTIAQVKAAMNNAPIYASVIRQVADYTGASLFSFATGTSGVWTTVTSAARMLQFTSANGASNNATVDTNLITINTSGVYIVTASVSAEVNNTNGWFGQLVKNASSVLTVGSGYNNIAGANGGAYLTYIGSFVATDTLDIRLGAVTAGTLQIDAFSINLHLLTN